MGKRQQAVPTAGKLHSKENTLKQTPFTAFTAGSVAVFDTVIEREDGEKVPKEKVKQCLFSIRDSE